MVLRTIVHLPSFYFRVISVGTPTDYLTTNATTLAVALKSPSGSNMHIVGVHKSTDGFTRMPISSTEFSIACTNRFTSCADVSVEMYLELISLPKTGKTAREVQDAMVALVGATIAGQHSALSHLEHAVRAWKPDRTPFVLALTGGSYSVFYFLWPI
jgi:hypothetical protein